MMNFTVIDILSFDVIYQKYSNPHDQKMDEYPTSNRTHYVFINTGRGVTFNVLTYRWERGCVNVMMPRTHALLTPPQQL